MKFEFLASNWIKFSSMNIYSTLIIITRMKTEKALTGPLYHLKFTHIHLCLLKLDLSLLLFETPKIRLKVSIWKMAVIFYLNTFLFMFLETCWILLLFVWPPYHCNKVKLHQKIYK